MTDIFESDVLLADESLADWVMTKCDNWRNHYEGNYAEKHQEYYRLWRGIWAQEDSTRASERSRIIAPALQQAVESNVAEMEEATFGRGRWFDISDDVMDQDSADAMFLRNKLEEDFAYNKVRKAVSECLINAAVFGTGIGELVIEERPYAAPATQPLMDGQLQAFGVNITERVCVKMNPVLQLRS